MHQLGAGGDLRPGGVIPDELSQIAIQAGGALGALHTLGAFWTGGALGAIRPRCAGSAGSAGSARSASRTGGPSSTISASGASGAIEGRRRAANK